MRNKAVITKMPGCKKKQQGITLLMLVIIIALAASSYYFSTISAEAIRLDNDGQTQAVLKQAKQALIAYAVTHADGNGGGGPGEYGFLPCPDVTNINPEGFQDPTCGGQFKNTLGYLPWRTLGTPLLRDSSGSCLWYAVSGSYKGGGTTSGLINDDTTGQLRLFDDTSQLAQDRVIAVVLAPDTALTGQNRNPDVTTACGQDFGNAVAYLEGDGAIDNSTVSINIDAIDDFIYAGPLSESAAIPFNDRVITITQNDIWAAIMTRSDINQQFSEATELLAQCLAEYANMAANVNRRLPWPAPVNVGDYRLMGNYSDVINAGAGYAGRFPFNINDSNSALGAAVNDVLLDDAICNAVSMPISGGGPVDLTDSNLVHRKLINNWKDHFFYAVSKDYALPDNAWTGCSGDCVSVNGNTYSAIVFFAASPLAGQQRLNADKAIISNYLENNNDVVFPDGGGNGAYTATQPASNDIIFCLSDSDPVTVTLCS